MKDIKGFTLIEILVSLAAFSLVMVAMGSAFYKIYNDWQRQRDYNLVLENGRWAMEFMSDEVRLAHADSTIEDAAESPLNAHELLTFEINPSSGSGPNEKIYYWIGESPVGLPFVLYRGKVSTSGSNDLNDASAVNVRRELCRFAVRGGDIFNVSSGCASTNDCNVTISLTVRPRPDQPEGSGNRNFTFRTLVRPRN